MLNDSSAGADGPEGSVYRANLRTAKATSTYILKGDPQGEAHQDSLTFYGFRYVSVTATDTVTITGLTGKVATSAIRDIGTVSTNDPRVNQLISNIRWGQRGNYLWVPTDCPQRDERLGWTGDTQVFSATGLYNADVAPLPQPLPGHRRRLPDPLRHGQGAVHRGHSRRAVQLLRGRQRLGGLRGHPAVDGVADDRRRGHRRAQLARHGPLPGLDPAEDR